MVQFIGILCVLAAFAILSAIAKALTKVTIRHSNMSETKQNVGCLYGLYLIAVPFVLGGIIIGGFRLYEKVIDPKLNEQHAKKFTEEDARKAISDFQNSWDIYSDCDSLIFVFDNGKYYLFPKDSIIESYKRKRNFEYFEMKEDKYMIYSYSSFDSDLVRKYMLDNYKKLNAKSFLADKHGISLFSSNDKFVQCVDGRIKFDAFILNIREKPIKKIVVGIYGNKENTFTLFLQDNKPHSCQKVIQKVDSIKCKKENDYQEIRIIDVIFSDAK
ncbi:MAG: hypothetical protein LBC68_02530 [Prevotellaceae bacterium]|jgi:hypothetical protein|nr:hypothetical protein [Prevotellaceae bacterium]